MGTPAGLHRALVRGLERTRRDTLRLLAPLDDDAVHRQHDRIMSPLVWDLGHVGNFEELWLLRAVGGRRPVDRGLDELYNPFDNPRWTRGRLPLPTRGEAMAYIGDVRADALRILRGCRFEPDAPRLLSAGYVYRMVTQHEAQHQETMLQSLDLRRAAAAYPPAAPRRRRPAPGVRDDERVVVPAGPFVLGTDTLAAYDNERPAHRVELGGFAIDRYPVTARRWAAFVADGGYERRELWTDQGRAWLDEHGHRAPQGWLPDGHGGWLVRRFRHVAPLEPSEPVEHVCHHEAEAFARWAGGRLPTEAEWEKAARWDPAAGRARTYPWGQAPPTGRRANLDRRWWGPAPVGSYPSGASAYGVEQLVGDVYEWTSSTFEPYPGYRTFPYPEYSEVFFGGDYRVLRGASWATSPAVARASYRNWDHPLRRQIFAGVRLAWDLPPGEAG
jgi:iron(II)-dependent oxidoreductase